MKSLILTCNVPDFLELRCSESEANPFLIVQWAGTTDIVRMVVE